MTLDAQLIKQLAAQAGFHACGIAKANPDTAFAQHLDNWLQAGCQADMHYMERNRDKRADPTLLYPGAQSVICLLLGYKPSRTMTGKHQIAQFAYFDDYHSRIKPMLHSLSALIAGHYPDFSAKPCVDTVPICEKHWAAQAGLGWIGRNTLLINPTYGSYIFLAELVTTSPTDHYDTSLPNRCPPECNICRDACPNRALSDTGLDANRCTAYQTIECRDNCQVDNPSYAFGCDICQLHCPFNSNTPATRTADNATMQRLQALPSLTETQFNEATEGTPLQRITFEKWQKNLLHK